MHFKTEWSHPLVYGKKAVPVFLLLEITSHSQGEILKVVHSVLAETFQDFKEVNHDKQPSKEGHWYIFCPNAKRV